MKRFLLGSRLGPIALALRDSLELVSLAYRRPEAVGTAANDQIATFLVTRMCASGEVFVDVGAHIGSVIAGVARHSPGASIVAFEAVPEKVAHLRRTFPRVEVHQCALGEADGDATFYVNARRSGFSSLGRPEEGDRADVTELTVPLRRLDGIAGLERMHVMKIDVEGAELGVLRGAERRIAASRPTIMFESGITDGNGLGYSERALWSWFAERRYEVLVPNRVAHLGPALSEEGFLESHAYPLRTTNYFAVPAERRSEVRELARAELRL